MKTADSGAGELLTASYAFMTDELASYYGVEAGAGEPDLGGPKRADTGAAAGLLTHRRS
ncbi:hypothetical protein [Nannocystis pusilla]|uniref:hypothetical protein n=1 Tax=Nannocystis pusilla TaxID=889268 RepID=UPI003DA6BBEC